MPDLFISHAHLDVASATAICEALEAAGQSCWIAPRDIPPGRDFDEAIVEAVESCRAMVLVFSSRANGSRHVIREVRLAADARLPILPVRIEDVPLAGGLRYYLQNVQWLDDRGPSSPGAFAASVSQALGRLRASKETVNPPDPAPQKPPSALRSETESSPTLIVDGRHGSGDHTTIGAAVEAAAAGTTILVRPGIYRESLTLQKPVNLVGAGDRDQIVIKANNAAFALAVMDGVFRISGLTLAPALNETQTGVILGDVRSCTIEDCDMRSFYYAIRASGTTQVTVERSRLRGVIAVEVQGGAWAFIGGNDICGVTMGILVCDGAGALVSGNTVRDGDGIGVAIKDRGDVRVTENKIEHCIVGVSTWDHARPYVHRNRITACRACAVVVASGAAPTIEKNEISGSLGSGLEVQKDADPIVRGNLIQDGRGAGVRVSEGGRGRFIGNVIRRNAGGQWSVDQASQGLIVREGNTER